VSTTTVERRQGREGGVGTSAPRPDGGLKVRGEFAFSSDLYVEGMLWGQTVRSPHPAARIRRVSTGRARSAPGVKAVLTWRDVPGRNRFGLVAEDQPVLAEDVVRCQGEAVALVAATSPEAARRAAALVEVDYEPLDPVTDPRRALEPDAPRLHPDGNVVRRLVIRRGDARASAPIVVTGEYEVGMQDQAPLGTESGLAVPSADGGVEVYTATQWLHMDRTQLAGVLDLPPELVRLQLAGVGGAFGAKEDLSVQAHLALLALSTGRPVKMVYSREESFLGHVHRHPARLRYEHGADRDGRLVFVRCDILLDGGAYASTTVPVTSNAACFSVGPYACPNVDITVHSVYTNNPPCGAMRGFGAVQVAFAHESQMDRVAAEAGISPLEVRRRNALRPGCTLPTGQDAGSSVPVLALLDRLEALPLPPADGAPRDVPLPGGAANVTHGEGVVRGVGYAVGFKNGGMPEGISDYATARVSLRVDDGEPIAEVHTAAAELGQGLVAVQTQIVRTELGVRTVVLRPADTRVGSAGTSSASRQTYMTGGAVLRACEAVRTRLLRLANERLGHRHRELLEADESFRLVDGVLLGPGGDPLATIAEILRDEELTEDREFHNRGTHALDADTGQGNAHLQFLYCAHRAVVDVDVDTGLVSVVALDVAQDVGRAVNPLAVEGQMEGGSAQGLGLALMEEVRVAGGRVLNPSFTDYLVPTILDVPRMRTEILELPDPDAPYGVKGAGEPSTISSTPAIVAAIRAATGRPLQRVPVRPDDIVDPDR
jgi:xanthine dehydrogenase D subunit